MKVISRLIIYATLAVSVFDCLKVNAQSSRNDLIANIEQALARSNENGQCLPVKIPQGEPGAESPRGTKYLFRCQQRSLAINVFLLYGETKADVEKALFNSQKFLAVNLSKEVEGVGEKAYELVQDRYGWMTFRKANIYCKVNVGIWNSSEIDARYAGERVSQDMVKETMRRFARIIVNQIPAR